MIYKPEKGSRQPVVLYDKDNKAIDVSGIEELASVKIDTGKIAGDLKLVKDNQGRLYGKYGEAWIPVKVDSEGRPIISQGPAGTEPWPVQLSGNNLDESDNIKVADSNVSQQIVGLNQSIASLQTQISNLANIIGQMKGYDGSAWKNLKVDSQGRPVLASDVTVNAEGLVVDVGELDITDRPERELGKVSLSGTMTERYGADINSRPPADTVPAGATFTIVDESGYFQTWISDGTKWVEV